LGDLGIGDTFSDLSPNPKKVIDFKCFVLLLDLFLWLCLTFFAN
jgi:hypothetical protein